MKEECLKEVLYTLEKADTLKELGQQINDMDEGIQGDLIEAALDGWPEPIGSFLKAMEPTKNTALHRIRTDLWSPIRSQIESLKIKGFLVYGRRFNPRDFDTLHDEITKAALEAFADCECAARQQEGITTALAPTVKITSVRPSQFGK